MLLLHDFSVSIQGFVNCCVWASSPVLRQHVSAAWHDCRRRARRQFGAARVGDRSRAALGDEDSPSSTSKARHVRLSVGSSDAFDSPSADTPDVMADFEYGLMDDQNSYSYFPDTFGPASGADRSQLHAGLTPQAVAKSKFQPPLRHAAQRAAQAAVEPGLGAVMNSSISVSASVGAGTASPSEPDDFSDVFRQQPLSGDLFGEDVASPAAARPSGR